MAKAEFWQRGEALDYTNATTETIPNNTIVKIDTRLGVTGCSIEPGQKGSLHVGGVWEVAKTSTKAIPMGTTVYFDGTGMTETNAEGSVEAGYAAADAAADATTMFVKLRG